MAASFPAVCTHQPHATSTGNAPSPAPIDTPAGPSPGTPGPDLNRWEYLGCFENPPLDEFDFDQIPSDENLTPTVSGSYHAGVVSL